MRAQKRITHLLKCVEETKVCASFAIIADLCRKCSNSILKAWISMPVPPPHGVEGRCPLEGQRRDLNIKNDRKINEAL